MFKLKYRTEFMLKTFSAVFFAHPVAQVFRSLNPGLLQYDEINI